MNWAPQAEALAERVTDESSRWRRPVVGVPRHVFVPKWWERSDDGGWLLRDGLADPVQWLHTAYRDTSLVTRVGPQHADWAGPGDKPGGPPTSSATLPSLLVRMFQHARIADSHQLLDVGTGSGYGTALAAMRLGDHRVTSIDVDPYLVDSARKRLSMIGLAPRLKAVDATGDLPGSFDRIVATVGVRPVPAGWLAALKPGGRLVTTIAGTSLIVTAAKGDDGSARGQVEWDGAGFMRARHGPDYPPESAELIATARAAEGECAGTVSPYPAINLGEAWDVASMLEIEHPGVMYGYEADERDQMTWLAHPDGSWARATTRSHETYVCQSGPRGLWDSLDRIRRYWLQHGELPVRGANVLIKPDGRTLLARGSWRTSL